MVSSLKYWKYENGVYISPPFPDFTGYNRAKRFFIRSQITTDCDERNRVIRISVAGKQHERNVAQLKKLHLLDK